MMSERFELNGAQLNIYRESILPSNEIMAVLGWYSQVDELHKKRGFISQEMPLLLEAYVQGHC